MWWLWGIDKDWNGKGNMIDSDDAVSLDSGDQ